MVSTHQKKRIRDKSVLICGFSSFLPLPPQPEEKAADEGEEADHANEDRQDAANFDAADLRFNLRDGRWRW